MMIDPASDTGTWYYDPWKNEWTHPITSNSWNTPYVDDIVYDSKNKKFVKFGHGWQGRDLWTYTVGDSGWTKEGNWTKTTLSSDFTSGEDHIHVTDATYAEAGGSVWIKIIPDVTKCDDCGECYAFEIRPITSVDGNIIYFGTFNACNSANAAAGTAVEIYPPNWPPVPMGSGVGSGLGTYGVFDDINNKILYFVPINTLPFVEGSGNGDIQVWAYDLATHSWEQKTGSGTVLGHRAMDLPMQWMHKHNAVIMANMNGTGTLGVNTTIRYYRYANTSVTIEKPENLTLTVNTNNIALSWDTVSGATGYYVYRESGSTPYRHGWTTKVASGGCAGLITGTSCTDATVSNGTTYYYRVTAYNGSVESNLSLMARGMPKIIWDGYVSAPDATHQNVHWVPRDTDVTSYKVYRALCTVEEYLHNNPYTVGSDMAPDDDHAGWRAQPSIGSTVFRRRLALDLRVADGLYRVKDVTYNGHTFTEVGDAGGLTTAYTYLNYGNWFYANLNETPPAHSMSFSVYQFADAMYSSDVVATAKPGAFTLVATCPGDSRCGTNSFADTQNLTGASPYPYKVYAYRVTSVNKLGIESGYSPYWLTIPRAPRHVNWKEINTRDVILKWDANPEEGIQGYHIYWQYGHTSISPMIRITASPVNSTTYTITDAALNALGITYSGGHNFMYYIVPVDALGQEGIPSARAWTRREYATTWTSQGFLQDYNSGIDPTPGIPSAPRGLRIIP